VVDWAFVCTFCFSQRHDDTTVRLLWLIELLCVRFVSHDDTTAQLMWLIGLLSVRFVSHNDTTTRLLWLIGLLCVRFVSPYDKTKLDIRRIVARNYFRRVVVSS
jgi:hypothetical protein